MDQEIEEQELVQEQGDEDGDRKPSAGTSGTPEQLVSAAVEHPSSGTDVKQSNVPIPRLIDGKWYLLWKVQGPSEGPVSPPSALRQERLGTDKAPTRQKYPPPGQFARPHGHGTARTSTSGHNPHSLRGPAYNPVQYNMRQSAVDRQQDYYDAERHVHEPERRQRVFSSQREWHHAEQGHYEDRAGGRRRAFSSQRRRDDDEYYSDNRGADSSFGGRGAHFGGREHRSPSPDRRFPGDELEMAGIPFWMPPPSRAFRRAQRYHAERGRHRRVEDVADRRPPHQKPLRARHPTVGEPHGMYPPPGAARVATPVPPGTAPTQRLRGVAGHVARVSRRSVVAVPTTTTMARELAAPVTAAAQVVHVATAPVTAAPSTRRLDVKQHYIGLPPADPVAAPAAVVATPAEAVVVVAASKVASTTASPTRTAPATASTVAAPAAVVVIPAAVVATPAEAVVVVTASKVASTTASTTRTTPATASAATILSPLRTRSGKRYGAVACTSGLGILVPQDQAGRPPFDRGRGCI